MLVMAAIQMEYVGVGDCVAKMKGLPIGGFLSKLACSLVLGVAESKWASTPDTARRLGFLKHDQKWTDAVAWYRYVDDILLVSTHLCRQCLLQAVASFSPVTFDPTDDTRRLKWLDMIIDLENGHVALYDKPHVMPPPWSVTARELRAYVIGRIARWKEIRMLPNELVYQCARLIIELSNQGWKPLHFRHLYYSIRGKPSDSEYNTLRIALHLQFCKDGS